MTEAFGRTWGGAEGCSWTSCSLCWIIKHCTVVDTHTDTPDNPRSPEDVVNMAVGALVACMPLDVCICFYTV